MINNELQQKLMNMKSPGLAYIQSYYQNNPDVKKKCQEISDFVDKILQSRTQE
jgi:hypothetical protein